jgi:hypothetical protein
VLQGLKRHVAAKIDRAVKNATPENVARRPGESVPIWSLGDPEHRALGAEIDGCYGNRLGGVDRGEIATFTAEMGARIEQQRVLLATCKPGSTAHKDTLATIHRWEQLVLKAAEIDAVIQGADLRILNDVAGMVHRQGSGLFKAFAALVTSGAGEVASKLNLHVNAQVGGKR